MAAAAVVVVVVVVVVAVVVMDGCEATASTVDFKYRTGTKNAFLFYMIGGPPRGELNLQPRIPWKQSRILLSHSNKSWILS